MWHDFSATAYFFGIKLYDELHVPIGLINTSWGGTVAEAWTSPGSLRLLKDFDDQLNRIDSIKPNIQKLMEQDDQNKKQWEASFQNIQIKICK